MSDRLPMRKYSKGMPKKAPPPNMSTAKMTPRESALRYIMTSLKPAAVSAPWDQQLVA